MNNTPTATAPANVPLTTLSVSSLARVIRRDWGQKLNFAARPYVDAMLGMEKVTDSFGQDSGASIILYFLNNAGTWRGETAKAVKAELKARLKAAGVRF